MAHRKSSIAAKVRFEHIPEDGKTPVYDSATKKWTYVRNPSAMQLTATEAQLTQMRTDLTATSTKAETASSKADTASLKADTASLKADTAQQTADSKVTAEEAVEETRDGLFIVSPIDGPKFRRLLNIEFREVETSRWEIWMNWSGANIAPDSSESTGWLRYATPEEIEALYGILDGFEQRLSAIEQRLGIS